MKQKLSFLLAGILLLLSISSAACSSEKSEPKDARTPASAKQADSQSQETAATGRYREETISFPLPVETVFDTETREGSVRILFEQKPGDLSCCKSTDNGLTWQQEPWNADWLPQGCRVVSACFAPEGTLVASTGKISDNPLDEQHATGAYTYFRLTETEQGLTAAPLSLELPEPKEAYLKKGYGLGSLTCSQDGKLFGVLQYSLDEEHIFQVLGFDLKSGALDWKRDEKAAEVKVYGNSLYLNAYDGTCKTLNPSSGKDLAETASPSGKVFFSCMDINPEKEKIFYCDKTGIYGSDTAMALSELLVDGRLSSFSDISCDIKYFFHINEKVFLLFLADQSGENMKLLRYEYDPKLATQPEQEIRIFSLTSNDAIKKLISDFQSSHPDVLVNYEVGMEDSNAKDTADVINILNTEIMAGNGPDILFLNGLPWESYQEKGILMDLGGSLASAMEKDKVFENLFDAYKTEGRQYAIPISFSISLLAGEKSQIASAASLDSLLEMASGIEGISPLDAGNFLPYVFSIFWQDIQKTDGSISREAVENLLETVGKFDSLLQPKEDIFPAFSSLNLEADMPYDGNACSPLDIWNVVYKNSAASVGYLGSIQDFTAISDHIPGQNLSCRLFPAHVFLALAAGINSKSSQIKLSEEFLAFALSEEGQTIFVDGSLPVFPQFPVNRQVWDAMAKKPSEEELERLQQIFQMLGGSFDWLPAEEYEKLKQEVLELDTPAMEDTVVLDAISASGSAYLSGGKSLDTAVNEIMQTLELYLAE